MPLRTISRAGEGWRGGFGGVGRSTCSGEDETDRPVCPTRASISRITASGDRLRLLPRTNGITQKEQRLLQPSWIFRMGRVWWDSPPRMGAERNSGWLKMSPVRIWARWGELPEAGILPGWGATCCSARKEWKGASGEAG